MRAQFSIAWQDEAALHPEDVTLLYQETAEFEHPYLNLPLTTAGNTLVGDYGPERGFPLADATSQFKVKFDPSKLGEYTVTIRLVSVQDNKVIAEKSFPVDVTLQPATISVDGLDSIEAGKQQDFTVSTDAGSYAGQTVRAEFQISSSSGAPTGSYRITAELIDLSNNKVLAKDQRTVEVTE